MGACLSRPVDKLPTATSGGQQIAPKGEVGSVSSYPYTCATAETAAQQYQVESGRNYTHHFPQQEYQGFARGVDCLRTQLISAQGTPLQRVAHGAFLLYKCSVAGLVSVLGAASEDTGHPDAPTRWTVLHSCGAAAVALPVGSQLPAITVSSAGGAFPADKPMELLLRPPQCASPLVTLGAEAMGGPSLSPEWRQVLAGIAHICPSPEFMVFLLPMHLDSRPLGALLVALRRRSSAGSGSRDTPHGRVRSKQSQPRHKAGGVAAADSKDRNPSGTARVSSRTAHTLLDLDMSAEPLGRAVGIASSSVDGSRVGSAGGADSALMIAADGTVEVVAVSPAASGELAAVAQCMSECCLGPAVEAVDQICTAAAAVASAGSLQDLTTCLTAAVTSSLSAELHVDFAVQLALLPNKESATGVLFYNAERTDPTLTAHGTLPSPVGQRRTTQKDMAGAATNRSGPQSSPVAHMAHGVQGGSLGAGGMYTGAGGTGAVHRLGGSSLVSSERSFITASFAAGAAAGGAALVGAQSAKTLPSQGSKRLHLTIAKVGSEPAAAGTQPALSNSPFNAGLKIVKLDPAVPGSPAGLRVPNPGNRPSLFVFPSEGALDVLAASLGEGAAGSTLVGSLGGGGGGGSQGAHGSTPTKGSRPIVSGSLMLNQSLTLGPGASFLAGAWPRLVWKASPFSATATVLTSLLSSTAAAGAPLPSTINLYPGAGASKDRGASSDHTSRALVAADALVANGHNSTGSGGGVSGGVTAAETVAVCAAVVPDVPGYLQDTSQPNGDLFVVVRRAGIAGGLASLIAIVAAEHTAVRAGSAPPVMPPSVAGFSSATLPGSHSQVRRKSHVTGPASGMWPSGGDGGGGSFAGGQLLPSLLGPGRGGVGGEGLDSGPALPVLALYLYSGMTLPSSFLKAAKERAVALLRILAPVVMRSLASGTVADEWANLVNQSLGGGGKTRTTANGGTASPRRQATNTGFTAASGATHLHPSAAVDKLAAMDVFNSASCLVDLMDGSAGGGNIGGSAATGTASTGPHRLAAAVNPGSPRTSLPSSRRNATTSPGMLPQPATPEMPMAAAAAAAAAGDRPSGNYCNTPRLSRAPSMRQPGEVGSDTGAGLGLDLETGEGALTMPSSSTNYCMTLMTNTLSDLGSVARQQNMATLVTAFSATLARARTDTETLGGANAEDDVRNVRVIRAIGQGGCSVVLLARLHAMPVAVKVVLPLPDDGEEDGDEEGAGGKCAEKDSDRPGRSDSKNVLIDSFEVAVGEDGDGRAGRGAGRGNGGGGSGRCPESPAKMKAMLLQRRLRLQALLRGARELAVLTAISHPNIVQVYSYCTRVAVRDDGAPAGSNRALAVQLEVVPEGAPNDAPLCTVLIMEYCDMGSLADAIDSGLFARSARAAAAAIASTTASSPGASSTATTPAAAPKHLFGPLYSPSHGSLLYTPAPSAASAASNATTVGTSALYSAYLTLLEVALALRHLHSMNLVHCDVKPANVLLRSSATDPRGFTAKLTDFGFVNLAATGTPGIMVDGITGGGSILGASRPESSKAGEEPLGTITHMSPEIILGSPPEPTSDIYSFGILMWEVYTGRAPYPEYADEGFASVPYKVVKEGLRPRFPPDTPLYFRHLAMACWSSDATRRPTASSLVSRLQSLLDTSCSLQGGQQPSRHSQMQRLRQ